MAAIALSGCATQVAKNPDPFKAYNQAVFRFNNDFMNTFVRPVSGVYHLVTTHTIRQGVTNAFHNVGTVSAIANDVLQANFKFALYDTLRFILNSTLGLFGLVDVASDAGIPAHTQNFGLTLDRWGLGPSPYFVLPFFGPNTLTGSLGMIPNYFLSPTTYIESIPERSAIWGLSLTNTAYRLIPAADLINETAIDPYIATRNAYLQRQKRLIYLIKHEKYSVDGHVIEQNNQQSDF